MSKNIVQAKHRLAALFFLDIALGIDFENKSVNFENQGTDLETNM